MSMFGGEEVSAIVVDIGSSSFRAGFAGDDYPKAVFPSQVGVLTARGDQNKVGNGVTDMEVEKDTPDKGKATSSSSSVKYFVGNNSLTYRRDFMEIQTPFKDGLITEWDYVEQLLTHGFSDRLTVSSREHPVLMAEPAFNTRFNREKVTSLLFEKFETPAVFLAKNPVLAAFASGKSTALVLESGAGITCVTPVVDGYALTKSITRSSFAGDAINQQILKFLDSKKVVVKPYYAFKKEKISDDEFKITDLDFPNTTQSYRDFCVNNIINDAKKTVFRVSETPFDEESNQNIPSVPLELPDGTEVPVGTERFTIPETLFKETPVQQDEAAGGNKSKTHALHLMAYESIMKCDADSRKELFGTTILAGGNTLFQGLPKRFERELSAKAPSSIKVRQPIAPAVASERIFSVWLGGSILASLGSFQQMWISKAEYEEYGATIVHKKCP